MMGIFKKKVEKILTSEQESEYKKLKKLRDKQQTLFESLPEGTKEKGDALLDYIKTTEKQFKIKSTPSDMMGLKTIKIMYKTGLRLRKWKR